MDETISKTIRNLENNNINAFFTESSSAAIDKALELINKDDVIGMGGSMTLDQIGLIDALKKGGYNLLDWVYEDMTGEEKIELCRKSLHSDVFLTSTNALTSDGKLVNKDGRGNRLSALIFGPKKVIVIAGKNKIVDDIHAGLKRIEMIAGPLNAKRLKRNTPCVESGECMDCASDGRICRHTVITECQSKEKRISVIIVDEELGL